MKAHTKESLKWAAFGAILAGIWLTVVGCGPLVDLTKRILLAPPGYGTPPCGGSDWSGEVYR